MTDQEDISVPPIKIAFKLNSKTNEQRTTSMWNEIKRNKGRKNNISIKQHTYSAKHRYKVCQRINQVNRQSLEFMFCQDG